MLFKVKERAEKNSPLWRDSDGLMPPKWKGYYVICDKVRDGLTDDFFEEEIINDLPPEAFENMTSQTKDIILDRLLEKTGKEYSVAKLDESSEHSALFFFPFSTDLLRSAIQKDNFPQARRTVKDLISQYYVLGKEYVATCEEKGLSYTIYLDCPDTANLSRELKLGIWHEILMTDALCVLHEDVVLEYVF